MDASDRARQTVRITIFNQTYTVTTAGDPAVTERLALEIDELMSGIARRSPNLDAARIAVLACLHLADKLKTTESELQELRDSVVHKSRNFAELLDQAFQPVKDA